MGRIPDKWIPDNRIPYKWVVAIVVVCGTFMNLLDTTSVNVALPTLAREFDASVSQIEWVILGYLLSLAVCIPASGWLGDRFGTKKVFLFAVVVFTMASALCGAATTLTQLTVFRIVQGAGGGMLIPVGTAMLFRAFPPIERARASTVLMIPMTFGPSLGPVFGGWLVTYHSWRWIFWLNLPIGILAFALGAVGLREHREPNAGRFDLPGFVLSAFGLASVLFALSRGPSEGWVAPDVVIPAVLGIVAFIALVWVETHVEEPMLALRLLRERMFRNANIVSMCSFASFTGLLFLLPLFLQGLYGLSAIESGLTTFPMAVGLVIATQVSGRLYHYVGPRRLLFGGLAGMALVSVTLVAVDLDTSLWVIRGIMFLRGLTLGLTLVPMQAASYANIAPADTGRATSIFTASRQFASSLGVAIIATVLVEATTRFSQGATTSAELQSASLSAFHVAFFAGACMVMIAAFSALLIRDRDAASTIRRYIELDHSPEPVGSTDPAV